MFKNKLMPYDYISRGGTPHFSTMCLDDSINPRIDYKIRGKKSILPKFEPEFKFEKLELLPF